MVHSRPLSSVQSPGWLMICSGDDTSQDIGDQNQSESSKRGIPKNQPGFNGVIEGASPVGSAGACGNRICLEFDRLTT